jgi:hypothetical protein
MIIGVAAALSLLGQAQLVPPSETWRARASERGTILSFGEPDNAAIQIHCLRPGILRIYLAGLYTGDGPEPRRVAVRSSRVRGSYRFVYGADADGGFSTDIPAGAPVMVAFERNGNLSFEAANAEVGGNATTPAEIRAISAFIRRCRV